MTIFTVDFQLRTKNLASLISSFQSLQESLCQTNRKPEKKKRWKNQVVFSIFFLLIFLVLWFAKRLVDTILMV